MKCLVSGIEFDSMRVLATELIGQSLVAAAAGVPHKRRLWRWLAEMYVKGDGMEVEDAQRIVLQLCDELWTAYKLAGVAREDLKRLCVEAKTAEPKEVERRVSVAAARLDGVSGRR